MKTALRIVGCFFCAASWALTSAAEPVVFKVGDCKLAEKPLKTRPAREMLVQVAGGEIESVSPTGNEQWVTDATPIKHPFLAAAHLSFAGHRPLALGPDMIWQLLVQQAAKEVNDNPEKYRELFATHERGRRTLSVRRDDFVLGKSNNDWPGVFAELEGQIVKSVPNSPARDFAHAFSTSTPTDIAARRVLVLNAAAEFYDYYVGTLCGIPRIELHGTVDDWNWLRTKTLDLKRFNMERRVKALQPVLDELVAAAGGKANPAFWRSFYKYGSESGGSSVSGWINLFFIAESDKKLDVVLDPEFLWTNPVEKQKYGPTHLALALRTRHYESLGVVDVDFVWDYLGKSYPMLIRAGFMGVAQDPGSLTLKPSTAWQVTHVKLSSEERKAIDYLGNLEEIHWGFRRALDRDFVFDPASGSIKIVKGQGSRELDSRFWRKAVPFMHRLKSIEVSELFDDFPDPKENRAICEAMLSARSVTEVYVPNNLDPECLEILRSRKDWEVIFPKKN